jgi:hypothetical protein
MTIKVRLSVFIFCSRPGNSDFPHGYHSNNGESEREKSQLLAMMAMLMNNKN